MRHAAILLLLLFVPVGCDAPAPGTGRSSVEVGDLDVPDVPDVDAARVVSGSLAGEEFEAVDVYFRRFHVGGQDRVDLVFADVAQDDCGLPLAREGRRVFVRFDGLTELPAGAVTVDREGEGDISIHYEKQLEGRWVGVGVGVARLELDEVTRSEIHGRMHLCFDDGRESCVTGAFAARRCLSRLDGDLPREGTGLSDPPSADEAAR